MEADSIASSVGPVATGEPPLPLSDALSRLCPSPFIPLLLLPGSSNLAAPPQLRCVWFCRRTRSLWDRFLVEVCVWFQGSRFCEWEFPAAVILLELLWQILEK